MQNQRSMPYKGKREFDERVLSLEWSLLSWAAGASIGSRMAAVPSGKEGPWELGGEILMVYRH